MYPAKPGLIVGFHGCDKTWRDEIVKGKTSLEISNNLYDWLGNGIYFWENNQQRALEFAKELFITNPIFVAGVPNALFGVQK
jgi:hypothetical protein